MRLSLTNLVCVLFDPAIPTSSFNFIQLFLYLLYFKIVGRKYCDYFRFGGGRYSAYSGG